MQFSAVEISRLINGKIEGDPEVCITSFEKIEDARQGQITFLEKNKYEKYLYTSYASIIILKNDHQLKQPVKPTIIRVDDPYDAFVTLLTFYKEKITKQPEGIQQPSFIASSAQLGKNIFIGAFCYLGENVKIGDNVQIHPNSYIGDNVQIGKDCIINAGVKIHYDCILKNNIVIHSGAVIGSDGFGFIPQKNGKWKKVPQIGNVVIEDDVEIGANTTIDRATLGSTFIRSGVKLDNQIQIAHNVDVGNSTVIAAQTGISGSTKIGKNVMMGGQTGMVEHISIADGTMIAAKSGVVKSISEPNTMVAGTPAIDYVSAARSIGILPELPQLKKRLITLEKLMKEIAANKKAG